MIEKGHTYYQSRKLDRVPKEAVEECSCTVEKHKTWIASPATIPKSGERNRKIHSCMLYLISIWTYQADTAISLLAVNARLPIVRTKQE